MACEKRCYPGRPSARRAARTASWRIHTYYCEECRAWHLSNAEKDDRRHYRRRQEDRWPNNRRKGRRER